MMALSVQKQRIDSWGRPIRRTSCLRFAACPAHATLLQLSLAVKCALLYRCPPPGTVLNGLSTATTNRELLIGSRFQAVDNPTAPVVDSSACRMHSPLGQHRQSARRTLHGLHARYRPGVVGKRNGHDHATDPLRIHRVRVSYRYSGLASNPNLLPLFQASGRLPQAGIPPAVFNMRAMCSKFHVMKVVFRLVKSLSGPPDPSSR